jgi:predicted HicB family RNase H-like nuclease
MSNEPTERVQARVPKTLKDRLIRLATADGRTLNGYLIKVLKSHADAVERQSR